MYKIDTHQRGFTIVELLIVIVIIGILAAITVISYNGITQRAQITAVQSNLRNIAQQMELFNADNGRYPDTSQGSPYMEITQVYKDANLYDTTRSPDGSTVPQTSFVVCDYRDNTSRFLVIAITPLLTNAASSQVGKKSFYISSTNGLQEFVFTMDSAVTGGGLNACKSADSTFPTSTGRALWSFHTPTAWAP